MDEPDVKMMLYELERLSNGKYPMIGGLNPETYTFDDGMLSCVAHPVDISEIRKTLYYLHQLVRELNSRVGKLASYIYGYSEKFFRGGLPIEKNFSEYP